MQDFKKIIQDLPNEPGVYRYYDKKNNLLYIGKAKSLKKRVSSYFQNSKSHNQRITLMVSLIASIEYTQVKTEKEALILEANLINNLQPKYNVALKDDKSYIFIEYTKSDPIPGFFLVRRKENIGSQYYGPYTNTKEVTEVMKILRTIFPFCQERYIRTKPCQYCSIKQCLGICTDKEDKESYLNRNKHILAILNGKIKEAQDFLKEKISNVIHSGNYELAGYYRDKLILLENISEKQKIVLKVCEDIDLINLVYQRYADGDLIGSFFVQQIRDGRIINVFNSIMAGAYEEDPMILLDNYLFNYNNKNGYSVPLLWSVAEYCKED
jgi:excinuclease ABC subunit C